MLIGREINQNEHEHSSKKKCLITYCLLLPKAYIAEVTIRSHYNYILKELYKKKSKRKVQGVPQSQTAALPRHQEEEETVKTKQAQIEETHEKH